jgi:hypothetical protein
MFQIEEPFCAFCPDFPLVVSVVVFSVMSAF